MYLSMPWVESSWWKCSEKVVVFGVLIHMTNFKIIIDIFIQAEKDCSMRFSIYT